MCGDGLDHLRDDKNKGRAFKRFDIQLTILLDPTFAHGSPLSQFKETRILAVVKDVSMSGMRIVSDIDMPVDALLLADFSIGNSRFCVPVIVRRCSFLNRPGKIVFTYGVQYIKCEATTKLIPVLAQLLLLNNKCRGSQDHQMAA